jgi:hypothetical protein
MNPQLMHELVMVLVAMVIVDSTYAQEPSCTNSSAAKPVGTIHNMDTQTPAMTLAYSRVENMMTAVFKYNDLDEAIASGLLDPRSLIDLQDTLLARQKQCAQRGSTYSFKEGILVRGL